MDEQAQESLPQFHTVNEIADQLAVSRETVRRLIASGDLPSYRFGGSIRIKADDVELYLLEHAVVRRSD